MEFRYRFGDEVSLVQVETSGMGYTVTVGEQTFTASAAWSGPGELWLTLNGVRRLAFVAAEGSRRWVAFDSQPFVLTVLEGETGRQATQRGRAGGHGSLEVQMPGVVRRVLVGAGEHVERGQVLLLLEAMKMEIKISAPRAGTVEKILVSEGQAVERGQSLVELGAKDSPF